MQKRQIITVLPWGNVETLLELPIDEPFAYGISHTGRETVIVSIHSGKTSPTAEKWCKTSIFICSSDGTIDERVFEGEIELDIDAVAFEDWQEWNYSRKVQAPGATDPYAREFQRTYLETTNPANQPALNPASPTYLDHPTITQSAIQTTDGNTALSTRAFALDERALEQTLTGVKGKSVWQADVTSKPPQNPQDVTTGGRIECTGHPLGWNTTRYEGSYTRLLAVSAYANDV